MNDYQSSQHKSSWVECYSTYLCLINGGLWCGPEFPITFPWPLPVLLGPARLLKDGEVNAKQPLWFSVARPVQPVMYKALCESAAALCMGCLPRTPFFVACCNAPYCRTRNGPGRQCGFETLIINFCQANLLGGGVMWMCLMRLPAPGIYHSTFYGNQSLVNSIEKLRKCNTDFC